MYNGSQGGGSFQQGSQMPQTTHRPNPSSGQFKLPGSSPFQMDQSPDPAQTVADQEAAYYVAGGQMSQSGYQGYQVPSGQLPYQGYSPMQSMPGANVQQFTQNQGYGQPPVAPRFVYDGPAKNNLMPPRRPRGTLNWLDKSSRTGLIAGVAILLVIVVVGITLLTTTSTPQNRVAQQTLSTPTVAPTDTSADTPVPTATPTLVPTATPVTIPTTVPVVNTAPTPVIQRPTPTPAPKPTAKPTVAPTATATATTASCPAVPADHVNDVEPTPPNPWCYDFNRFAPVANLIFNPPANFCAVMTKSMPNGNFRCNPNFANQTGFVGLCTDDSWARAPHRADTNDACKNDGGWEQDLFQHT